MLLALRAHAGRVQFVSPDELCRSCYVRSQDGFGGSIFFYIPLLSPFRSLISNKLQMFGSRATNDLREFHDLCIAREGSRHNHPVINRPFRMKHKRLHDTYLICDGVAAVSVEQD